MEKSLTYILGAGASFQSIPVVKTFNQRLLKFKEFLLSESNHTRVSPKLKKRYDEAAYLYEMLFNEFSSHHSFDTYFKKLFHLGDSKNINRKKRLLNLYFFWEHSKNSMGYNSWNEEGWNEKDFYKESLFDKRYDALIAGLLKPFSGRTEVVSDINFITWNYDINLLNSIKSFFSPDIEYGKFISRIQKNQFVWEIDKRIKIINVNGFFYSNDLEKVKDLSNLNFAEILEKKLSSGYHSNLEIDEDADKIRFAWELSEVDRNSLKEHLGNAIRSSENIIVVGYTFPVYNRLIDFGYLSQEDISNKKIVIQNPNAEELMQNLLDIYRIRGKTNIQAVSGCDSFYLPSSIFGINEYVGRGSVSG